MPSCSDGKAPTWSLDRACYTDRNPRIEDRLPSSDETASYRTVQEDLGWLWRDWWVGQGAGLSDADVRRGSATLDLLLVQGLLGRVWRSCGFPGQPRLIGPDLVGIASLNDVKLELAASLVAGGGRQGDIDMAFIGAFRVDNNETGVPAEADEGFAVLQTTVARLATDDPGTGDLASLVDRDWSLSSYLESPGAVRKGAVIKRREIIKYFRNYIGGAHHGVSEGIERRLTPRYELIRDLAGHVVADVRDGLDFELLSIGQSVARSPDIRRLTARLSEYMPAPETWVEPDSLLHDLRSPRDRDEV